MIVGDDIAIGRDHEAGAKGLALALALRRARPRGSSRSRGRNPRTGNLRQSRHALPAGSPRCGRGDVHHRRADPLGQVGESFRAAPAPQAAVDLRQGQNQRSTDREPSASGPVRSDGALLRRWKACMNSSFTVLICGHTRNLLRIDMADQGANAIREMISQPKVRNGLRPRDHAGKRYQHAPAPAPAPRSGGARFDRHLRSSAKVLDARRGQCEHQPLQNSTSPGPASVDNVTPAPLVADHVFKLADRLRFFPAAGFRRRSRPASGFPPARGPMLGHGQGLSRRQPIGAQEVEKLAIGAEDHGRILAAQRGL